MRIITDSDGRVLDVSFGALISCGGQDGADYTGTVPTGYTSLEDWFIKEADKLYRWTVVDGELTLDSSAVAPVDRVYEAVPLTVVSERLTGLSYTAQYYPALGMCFVCIYGVINVDMNTGYDYDILNIESRVPNARAALAVKCGKDCMAIAQSNGVISLRPMERLTASAGWAVYITGFWFA